MRFCREWQVGWRGRTGRLRADADGAGARAAQVPGVRRGRRRKAPERLADKVQEKKKPKKIEKAKARAAAGRGAVRPSLRGGFGRWRLAVAEALYKLPLQAMWQRLRADHGWRDALT